MNKSKRYISYIEAFGVLSKNLRPTKEEVAGWVYLGKKEGGLDAYLNGNAHNPNDNPAPKFYFAYHEGKRDYLGLLPTLWFENDDIDAFAPSNDARFITAHELIERWSNIPGTTANAFIKAKIKDSSLYDIHPTFGGTKAQEQPSKKFPPLKEGLYFLSQIISIEETELGHLQNQPLLEKIETKTLKDKTFAELLTPPQRVNDWYLAISEMQREFYTKHNRKPNPQEAWFSLNEKPPASFGISIGKYRGETALLLDDKPLTKESFYKRWSRYTANRGQ